MAYPTATEYQRALQNPAIAFPEIPELALAQAETTHLGLPRPYSGNFTATFRLEGNREWAVRCYTREVRDVAERYTAITNFLEAHSDPVMTMARLRPLGVLVASTRYDIIQMDWVSGDRLDDYVARSVAEDYPGLAGLAKSFLDLGTKLDRLGVAHGDIQHGNVIVDANRKLRLVDYDDMFLPDLRHLRFSSGLGQENYQHPGRVSTDFDEKLDRFSIISIYITLLALSVKPDLWQRYEGGDDNLLFRKADFLDPRASPLFDELDSLIPLKEYIDRFASICQGEYWQIPSVSDFLDGRFLYSRFVPNVVKTRLSSRDDAPAPTLPFRARPMGTPPSIGTDTVPSRSTQTDTTASVRTQTEAAQRISAASQQVSPLLSSLPPSAAGIPPSGAGIPPLDSVPEWSISSLAPQDSGGRLLRVLAVAAGAVILIGLSLGFFGSRKARSPEAEPTSVAKATQASTPASRLLRVAAERAPAPVESTRYAAIAASHQAAAQPTPVVVESATVSRTLISPPAEPRPVPRYNPNGSEATTKSADASEAAAPHLDQRPIMTASPTCSIPDGPVHLVAKAAPDLSPQTLAAATGKSAVVSVDIAADGSVRNTSIVTPTGDTRLDLAALSVATRSTYNPAEARCVASPGTITLTVSY